MLDSFESWRKRRFAPRARFSLGVVIAASVGLGLGACGSAHGGTGSASGASSGQSARHLALPTIEPTEDEDLDSDKRKHEPDNEREAFGHLADATDRRLVTVLVKRYYAAAAREQGAVACGLLYSVFAETVAETYGGPAGSPSLRGDTCAAVMTKIFTRMHHRLRMGAAVRVVAVRVDLNRASVQLGLAGEKPARYVMAHRERGAWKMNELIDVNFPVGVE
ncbi:MAG: hypothetical protein WAU42_04940 [Solirubrobacteraceae bacterium]